MNKRKVTSYPEEFKKSSAQLALGSDQPMRETAKELGVHVTTLHGWVKRYHPNHQPKQAIVSEEIQAELKRLRKALAQKEKECEILKKASAYFAKAME